MGNGEETNWTRVDCLYGLSRLCTFAHFFVFLSRDGTKWVLAVSSVNCLTSNCAITISWEEHFKAHQTIDVIKFWQYTYLYSTVYTFELFPFQAKLIVPGTANWKLLLMPFFLLTHLSADWPVQGTSRQIFPLGPKIVKILPIRHLSACVGNQLYHPAFCWLHAEKISSSDAAKQYSYIRR